MYLMNTHPVVVQQVVTRVTPIQRTVMSHRQRQQSAYDNKPKKEKKYEKNKELPLTLPKNCGTLYK